MKYTIITPVIFCLSVVQVHALTINEIMSNPTGTDNGREWIELYNETNDPIDIASLRISADQSSSGVAVTPLQGGTSIPPHGYAVIATIVSGQTKFLEDYPSYTGILFRVSSTLILTNAGASLYAQVGSATVASLPSYTAAREGSSLSLVGGSYVTGTPTPGADNQAMDGATPASTDSATSTLTTETQVTIGRLSPPASDITIYLPEEKTVVAGAATDFTVFSQTRAGKPITDLRYTWAFGDGGQGTGSSTSYRYAYSGRYITTVEALNATTIGNARMVVRVVPPDVAINAIGEGKYGSYIDINNPNSYALDLSQWVFSIDGATFPFPKNTVILPNTTIRFSGLAMGFASTTLASSSVVRILFPSLEEVTRYVVQPSISTSSAAATSSVTAASAKPKVAIVARSQPTKVAVSKKEQVLGVSTSTQSTTTEAKVTQSTARVKDTRLVSWFKSMFW